MKVGVYIDGFNLYYGGRDLCGRGRPGWRWLDLRALANAIISRTSWPQPNLERLVYCTARISVASNPSGVADQSIYLRALGEAQCVDVLCFGNFVERVKRSPLAIPDNNGRPVLTQPQAPIFVQDLAGTPLPNTRFLVSHAYREEKGSDVNVATHLLLDILQGSIEAAIVISNDSDLRLPIREARSRTPVGVVNPSPHQTAGALRGSPSDGVGGHWWTRLSMADFHSNQLPDPCGRYAKPQGW
jgi:uncharacterized LabA/DUF88 family protein